MGALLQRVQAEIRHKMDPPYGLPPIYSVLSLSSPPLRTERLTVFCFYFCSLVPRAQKPINKTLHPEASRGGRSIRSVIVGRLVRKMRGARHGLSGLFGAVRPRFFSAIKI